MSSKKTFLWKPLSYCLVFGTVVLAPLRAVSAAPIPSIEAIQPAIEHSLVNKTYPQEWDSLESSWGYGAKENHYNTLISDSISNHWTNDSITLPPRVFKALIAVESSFNPSISSPTGARGLSQLTPDTARRFGINPYGQVDERTDPQRALFGGIKCLMEKQSVITNPQKFYKNTSFTQSVEKSYSKYGQPQGKELWYITLAAYNGGGKTLLLAMEDASNKDLDPTRWENLAGDLSNPTSAPLYKACTQIYRGNAMNKYKEIRNYPDKIFALLQK